VVTDDTAGAVTTLLVLLRSKLTESSGDSFAVRHGLDDPFGSLAGDPSSARFVTPSVSHQSGEGTDSCAVTPLVQGPTATLIGGYMTPGVGAPGVPPTGFASQWCSTHPKGMGPVRELTHLR
jgi:hypothetical protein